MSFKCNIFQIESLNSQFYFSYNDNFFSFWSCILVSTICKVFCWFFWYPFHVQQYQQFLDTIWFIIWIDLILKTAEFARESLVNSKTFWMRLQQRNSNKLFIHTYHNIEFKLMKFPVLQFRANSKWCFILSYIYLKKNRWEVFKIHNRDRYTNLIQNILKYKILVIVGGC